MGTTQMRPRQVLIVVKEENLEQAKTLFEGTDVAITVEGKRYWELQSAHVISLKAMSRRKFQHG